MATPPTAKKTSFFALQETPLSRFAGEGPLHDPEGALRQLRAIERHVQHKDLGGICGALEEHYIDRDFIEDYSAFYAKNLVPIPNFCKRIHFFNLPEPQWSPRIRPMRIT